MSLELPNSISDATVIEFKTLYEKTYHETITYEHAKLCALRLVQIVYLLQVRTIE